MSQAANKANRTLSYTFDISSTSCQNISKHLKTSKVRLQSSNDATYLDSEDWGKAWKSMLTYENSKYDLWMRCGSNCCCNYAPVMPLPCLSLHVPNVLDGSACKSAMPSNSKCCRGCSCQRSWNVVECGQRPPQHITITKYHTLIQNYDCSVIIWIDGMDW